MLVIEGKSFDAIRKEQRRSWEEPLASPIPEHIDTISARAWAKQPTMKQVAKDRGVEEIYQALLERND